MGKSEGDKQGRCKLSKDVSDLLFSQESFSTKLRKLSDNTTSNFYVSNLPLDMSPHQLEQLFSPHLVVSLRILLDDNGSSRGVGFVRLRDRDTAQECIDKLHGKVGLKATRSRSSQTLMK